MPSAADVTPAPAPPRRRLSAADRRAAILDSALEVFSRRGFAHTTLAEVADHAGISKALIYEHFASKRELQRALLATYADDILQRVTIAAGEPATIEPRERLRAGIDAALELVEQRPAAWRMVTRNATDPDGAETIARLQARATRAIATLIEPFAVDLPDRPRERERALEAIAQLLSGAVQALASWYAEHPRTPRAVAVELAMAVLWDGLERLAGEAGTV